MKQRRDELEKRDRQRVEYMEQQNRKRAHQSLAKRMEKQKRIEAAKQQADATIAEQRALFKQREEKAAKALKDFEHKRSLERDKMKQAADEKTALMKQIFEDSQNNELQKKNKILQARSEAEKRQ